MKWPKAVTVALLAYATYLTVHCPCRHLMSCHKKELFLTLGGALTIIAYDNR